MQKKKRKQYTADFKAKVVKEMLREEKTVGQLAAEYEVHSNMLYRWREQMLAGLLGLFSDQAAQELAEAAQLHREGQPINQKTVARYMQEMGLAAVYPGPNLSKRAQQAALFPYLLSNITASTPNHIWGLDVRRVGAYGIPVRSRRGREN